jgi:hypothetical protein
MPPRGQALVRTTVVSNDGSGRYALAYWWAPVDPSNRPCEGRSAPSSTCPGWSYRADDHWARMPGRAASTGLGVTNALAMLRLLSMSDGPRTRRSSPYDTRSWSSTGSCMARRSVHPRRPGLTRRPATPTSPRRATQDPTTGTPRNGRSRTSPTGQDLLGSLPHCPVGHQSPGPAATTHPGRPAPRWSTGAGEPARRLARLGPPISNPRVHPRSQDDRPLPRPTGTPSTPAGSATPFLEATNNHLRLLTRIANGFHSADALIAMSELTVGGLCPHLAGRSWPDDWPDRAPRWSR